MKDAYAGFFWILSGVFKTVSSTLIGSLTNKLVSKIKISFNSVLECLFLRLFFFCFMLVIYRILILILFQTYFFYSYFGIFILYSIFHQQASEWCDLLYQSSIFVTIRYSQSHHSLMKDWVPSENLDVGIKFVEEV